MKNILLLLLYSACAALGQTISRTELRSTNVALRVDLLPKTNGVAVNLTARSLPGSTTAALVLSNHTGSAARLTEWRHTNGALVAWQGSNGNHFLVGNYTDDVNFGGLQLSATGGVNRLWSQTRGTGTSAPIDFSANSGVLSQLRLATNGFVGIGTATPSDPLQVVGRSH